MLALALAAWLTIRPYAGITQDALLYSFQALARLHPDSLGGDVFLANVSQDSFTTFPAAHALAIRWFGVEGAALALTLLGQAWWFAAASVVAWRLVGAPMALLSIALLAALPGYYGAYEVFRYAEPLVTSRLFSEAAILTGIAAVLSGQRGLALLSAAVAMTLHPLMGVAGSIVIVAMVIGRHGGWLMAVAVLTGLAGAVAVSRLAPVYPFEAFDPAWLELAQSRSPFLLAQEWNAETWAAVARTLVLGLLAVAAWRRDECRTLMSNALLVGLLGLTITIVGASLAQVVLLVQGQAWRWLWLTHALAVIAAPAAVLRLWRAGAWHRAGVLLAVASWLLVGWASVVVAVLAAACIVAGLMSPRHGGRPVLLASSVILGLAGVAYLASSAGELGLSASTLAEGAIWKDGVLLAALAVGCYAALRLRGLRWGAAAVCLLALATAVATQGSTWQARPLLPESLRNTLQAWQSVIPVDAEVYWPDRVDVVWFVLERRSFLSHLQTAGVLFSRQTAAELLRRSDYASPSLSRAVAFGDGAAGISLKLDAKGLQKVCSRGGADFVVSKEAFDMPQAAEPVRLAGVAVASDRPFYLYDCEQVRQVADTGEAAGLQGSPNL